MRNDRRRVTTHVFAQVLGGTRTSGRIKTSSAAIAFEMLSFLVRNEELQIFEITLACKHHGQQLVHNSCSAQDMPRQRWISNRTVITPSSIQHLLDVGMTTPLLAHLGEGAERCVRGARGGE